MCSSGRSLFIGALLVDGPWWASLPGCRSLDAGFDTSVRESQALLEAPMKYLLLI
jgi:hypothetical protein